MRREKEEEGTLELSWDGLFRVFPQSQRHITKGSSNVISESPMQIQRSSFTGGMTSLPDS